jgi:hypothetical protein
MNTKISELVGMCKLELYRLDEHVGEEGNYKGYGWWPTCLPQEVATFAELRELVEQLADVFPKTPFSNLPTSNNLFTLQIWGDNIVEVIWADKEYCVLQLKVVDLKWFTLDPEYGVKVRKKKKR